jgi:hypothetical protein
MTVLPFPRIPLDDPDPDGGPVSQAIPVDPSFDEASDSAEPRTLSSYLRDIETQKTEVTPCIACGAPSPSHDPGCMVERALDPSETIIGYINPNGGPEGNWLLVPSHWTLADLVAAYDRSERRASR